MRGSDGRWAQACWGCAVASTAAVLLVGCEGVRPSAKYDPHLFEPWERIATQELGVRFTGDLRPDVVAARRRSSEGGVRIYEGTLANSTVDHGENKVILVVREQIDGRPLPAGVGAATLDFTPQAVSRNFDSMFPGALQTSRPSSGGRNRYGPYHFVSAAYPGSSQCIYAWQHLDDERTPLGVGVADASLQLRYCDPQQTPAQLISMFDGIEIDL